MKIRKQTLIPFTYWRQDSALKLLIEHHIRVIPGELTRKSYQWDFGDATRLITDSDTVTNVYHGPARYRIRLTIKDETGISFGFQDVNLDPM